MSNSLHIKSQSGKIFDLQAPLARRRGAVLYLLVSFLSVACRDDNRARDPEWWAWFSVWVERYEGDLCLDLEQILNCTMFDDSPLFPMRQGLDESRWMKREEMIEICKKLVYSKPDFSKFNSPPLSDKDTGIEIDLKAWLYTLQSEVPAEENVGLAAL